MTGTAVQIYRIDGKKRSLDLNLISDLFRNIQDKQITVISVNGIKRSGKSFFLHFLLQFLRSDGHADDPEWFRRQFDNKGDLEPATSGFEWKGGYDRTTLGIWVWSEPIIVRNDEGQEVAVILMDTQGSFDGQTSFADCALIFATSVWLSSLFIYNIKEDLSEDKLQFLDYFSDFSKGIQGVEGAVAGPLFQHLFLLIRDWGHPQKYQHGWHEAGAKSATGNHTTDFLRGTPDQSEENLTTRRDIAAKFSTTSSFLMPHPGLPLAHNTTSTLTRLDQVEPLFVQHFQALLSRIRQEVLKPKIMYGTVQTGRSMLLTMRKWAQLLDSQDIPQAKSLTQATAEASLEMSLHRTEKLLNNKLLNVTDKGMTDGDFESERSKICDQVLDNFTELSSKFPKYQAPYLERLDTTIRNGTAIYVQLNASKRIEREQEARISAMQRETKAMGGEIEKQNALVQELQRNLDAQMNLGQQEKEELVNKVAQIKEETSALFEKQESELEEQKRNALELEKRVEETERQKLELSQQIALPQQYRKPQENESESSFADTMKAMASLTSAVAPLVLETIKYFGKEDEDEKSNAKPNVTIVGKYELVENGDNYGKYLTAIGVWGVSWYAMTAAAVIVTISERDGRYLIDIQSTFGSDSLSFVLGNEFTNETRDGHKASNLVTWKDNKLVHVQTLHNAKQSRRVTTRKFTEYRMLVTLESEGVTATRTFKRI